MARPANAPQHWELHDTEAFVRQSVLDRSPSVVLFQELPGLVPYIETHAMVGANPRTHSGNLPHWLGTNSWSWRHLGSRWDRFV